MKIKVRMIEWSGEKIKKLPNRYLTVIPRKGETILWDKKDYEIINVTWDFELDEHEVVLEIKQINQILGKEEGAK